MLALIVAEPGLVRDGLVALLEETPDVRRIMQIPYAADAGDFVNKMPPDITLIQAAPFTQELASFVSQLKRSCRSPVLAIVDSEEDRKTAVSRGTDVVVMEGLPSSKLAALIASLLQQDADTAS